MKPELADVLTKYHDAEFRYGALDCGLFVASVLRDWTGKDFGKPWRGRYCSEFGARRMVAEHKDMAGLASAAFGPMKPIWTARPGSPVLLNPEMVKDDSIGEALGIFDGSQVHCLTDKGLMSVPILAGRACWHV